MSSTRTIRRGYEVADMVLDEGAQLLYNGKPAVVVVAKGAVAPVRLFCSANPWGDWKSKWVDLDEAVRQTEMIAKYGYASKAGGGTVQTAPLQRNNDPATFVDYHRQSDVRADSYE